MNVIACRTAWNGELPVWDQRTIQKCQMLVGKTKALLKPQGKHVLAGAATAQQLAAIEAAFAGVDAFRQYVQTMLPPGPMRNCSSHVDAYKYCQLFERYYAEGRDCA